MKIDNLIKNTIDDYCKIFNKPKKQLFKEFNEITEEDKKLIKAVCEMKPKSIEEFKKEYPEIFGE